MRFAYTNTQDLIYKLNDVKIELSDHWSYFARDWSEYGRGG